MNPYQGLPDSAYWRTAVADKSMFDIAGLWQPKFRIEPGDAVSGYGSCFAQRIGRALREGGFNWFDAEPAPEACPPELAAEFGYGVFSARTGNIYTASLLDQWLAWATGDTPAPTEVWQDEGRFFDPFRPVIEPGGFASAQELVCSRQHAIAAFRRSIVEAKVCIFTLGLTERWMHKLAGHEYPMCPGTAAGHFDAAVHGYDNLSYDSMRASLHSALGRMCRLRADIKLILTVSPVPMTATASGQHVLLATMHSKSLLRTVASELAAHPQVDYFPSYEMINGTPFGGVFFESDKRNVSALGVQRVMDTFIRGVSVTPLPDAARPRPVAEPPAAMRRSGQARPHRLRSAQAGEVCEEALLDAFGPKGLA